jgi:hypothetical protein
LLRKWHTIFINLFAVYVSGEVYFASCVGQSRRDSHRSQKRDYRYSNGFGIESHRYRRCGRDGEKTILETMARVFDLLVAEIGPLSLQSKAPCRINGTCVTFAEPEVVSLLAISRKSEDRIVGVYGLLVTRISGMARKAELEPDIFLVGGGGLDPGLASALEDELMMDVHVSSNPQFNGAIGAALLATDFGIYR